MLPINHLALRELEGIDDLLSHPVLVLKKIIVLWFLLNIFWLKFHKTKMLIRAMDML